ncbi:MAG: AmmeMemoRadiSam system protein A [Campylobacterota bacterium]|nr:AmmeMemoRadiSam system protein A [Campylobacterota bacterium]
MDQVKTINNMLIQIVKGAIYSKLYKKDIIDKKELVKKIPNLLKRASTFVTISINGEIRGSMGTLVAHNTLIDDLLTNATQAAFEDPRFKPLSKEEFENIDIEISLLSQALEIRYKDIADLKSKINHGIDGVILRQGEKQATFLPQVWEELPNFEDFITHLFHKANITDLDTKIDVFVYQVEKIVEQ